MSTFLNYPLILISNLKKYSKILLKNTNKIQTNYCKHKNNDWLMVKFILKKYYNVNTHILIEGKRYCEKN